ncbi:hypothetical protein NN3_00710 [Nocardia neocaledoniensis NBRC 108232]|uniref:Excreted virulence factor EspC (Type VII ESX diderm) n=1 Tax=Nocardia neocaledoniensis TaxID=236511 RepID=A0A317NH94_9NOCA|nr:type VII secretion target [Nocardia neocaledoniensis]PWV74440.1 excreted virulence factor EspC (type VII ESX diderm) [Nocardia neocaledoniensis]GEM29064.1 hypothetical protein NN3_00710 [Nocardia neocaledoniensis NBRC 108232]
MSLDFDPTAAQEFVAVTRTQVVGDLAAATHATTAAAAAVPGLGLIGAEFRTQLIAALAEHATHLEGCANAVADQAGHVQSCRTSFVGHDQQFAAALSTVSEGQ